MAKITEDDVVKHYISLVIQECKGSYKGLEPEDRIAEGTLALIHAIRTYRIQYGCFEEYMLLQLRLIMKQKNKEAWAAKKLESIFSLDAPLVTHNASSTLSDFLRSVPHDDTIFDVHCFIKNLSPIEKQVVLLLLEDRDVFKVSNELRISLPQVQSIVKRIQSKFMIYVGLVNQVL
ncbi:hypothetical protein JCM16163A_48360 [Paenibacillus sp. YK5]|nr:RNA polymerase subunit sigma-70 [Paenibacillus sp. Pae108]